MLQWFLYVIMYMYQYVGMPVYQLRMDQFAKPSHLSVFVIMIHCLDVVCFSFYNGTESLKMVDFISQQDLLLRAVSATSNFLVLCHNNTQSLDFAKVFRHG